MLVSLTDVKGVLGIDPANTLDDARLTRLITAATLWIQGYTKRRFDTPIDRVEYQYGTDAESIILSGHIDDSPEADNPSETLDPTTSLVISSRILPRASPIVWEPMLESVDWERREDYIYALGGWGFWPSNIEYRLEYLDGYAIAPEDIREVAFELVMNQRMIELRAGDGAAGITSERLGDFSYSVDLTQVGAGGKGLLSTTSLWTLNGYKRLLVG
jgi:hypothetical protein